MSSTSTDTVPDSIFDRSRMSVIRFNRSVPAPWIVRANSTWRGVRLPSGLSPSCCPRIRMLFNGVRSSCDMLARNSDLYFEVSASSVAFSSRARRACSISWFLASTSTLRSASCCAFCSSCSLVCCNSRCWLCFFFQAGDGIRDLYVTGVQTCALPILFGRFDPLLLRKAEEGAGQTDRICKPRQAGHRPCFGQSGIWHGDDLGCGHHDLPRLSSE